MRDKRTPKDVFREAIVILFAVRSFLLYCIYGTNVLHVPFIELSLALIIWL